ncbi:hypothetical protein [Polymorphobacter megasporae]|uniref:hypothetical protein n=1 Tax=Glacieibacterium megasporae TaxID=2835787 RepID=UPI001C1E2D86|nr:hypothetical protein [Polymorphobacter megasporae]UAJ09637.1 hypothetical protein KTC28_15195 [Polymorphobacter megasporae]
MAIMGTAIVAIGPVVAALVVGVGLAIVLDMLDKHFGVTEKLGKLCEEGLDKLKTLTESAKVAGAATWHRLENSGAVRDLSRASQVSADWVERQASMVRWEMGFL